MPTYQHKDEVALAYDAFKKRLRNEISIAAAVVANEALTRGTEEFNAAVAEGGLDALHVNPDYVRELLAKSVTKDLSAGV